MKWQRLFNASACALLLVSFGCNAPSAAPTGTPAAPAAPTDKEIPPEPDSPIPELYSLGEPLPAAPAHYQGGDSIQLHEIYMLNPVEGWAISGPYVLRTADGGMTWREATPILPANAFSNASVEAHGVFLDSQTAWVNFSFVDQQRHWVLEVQVWHTTDGGQTWTPSAPLFHEEFGDLGWVEFAALNAENVWLMVRNFASSAGRQYTNHLFRTTDAGATWTPLVGDADAQFWVDVTGMAFSDPANGWVTWQTDPPAPPAYAVTADGGASWESRELPPPPDAPDLFEQVENCAPFQPNLLSTSSIRLLVGCFDYFDPPGEYLYASEDGGKTWEMILLPGPVLASHARLIYFDADHALLLGREMYSSADSGRTWTYVKTVDWDGQFSFVNQQQGWAIPNFNALMNTVDGGRTWALIEPVIGQ